jgi:hypothetical protein
MTTREANLLKGARACLKCGKAMWSDRCHRICVKCSHENGGILEERASVTQDLRQWLRGFVRLDHRLDSEGPPMLKPVLQED